MAKIDSEIKLGEKVENKERRFGSSKAYFPVYVTSVDGEPIPALFTGNQIQVAVERARVNEEDIPQKDGGGFLSFIFG